MRFVKQLFNFYINCSIHVAISVLSLTWITFLELDIEPNTSVLLFVFFASITGYNFVKYFGIAKFHHRQLASWLKIIQLISLICFLLMCYYAFQLHSKTLIFIASFAVLTFLYAIPFFSKKQLSLRHIGGLKVFIIGTVWAGVTVFIPIVNEDLTVNTDIIIIGLQRFLFVLILMLPFEIRDLKFDALKLSTIPQKLGIKKTKQLGFALLIVFFLLDFFKDKIQISHLAIHLVMSVLTFISVLGASVNQRMYYSSFWVEGLPILWLLMLII